MKKILCPTDFSETANNAIGYAAKLAQVMHSDLTLLNVQSLFDLTPVEVFQGKKDTLERAAHTLEAQAHEVSRAFKVSCYAEVEPSYNKLSAAISDRAQKYDLIVMGSNGPDDLYQFFSGSNTYNAILKTKTPLLLIPAGVEYAEIKLVVYAFDYLRERNLPLAGLKPFIKGLNCNLKVLQVMEEAYSREAETDLKELQYIIKSFYNDLSYEFDTIRSDENSQSINSYMLRNQADVLALCSVHRNVIERFFHKSTIKTISSFCNYPLYVFHP
jgi:nucleotide-binding universal stress UspA family protein